MNWSSIHSWLPRARVRFPALLVALGLVGCLGTSPQAESALQAGQGSQLTLLPALRVYDVRVHESHHRAVITWDTTTRAGAAVELIGLAGPRRIVRASATDESFHRITLTALEPETRYMFSVVSRDRDGNVVTCGPLWFHTRPAPCRR